MREEEDLGRLPSNRERIFGLFVSLLLFLLFGAASLVFVHLESLAAGLVSALFAVVSGFVMLRATFGTRKRLGVGSIRFAAKVFVAAGVLGVVTSAFQSELADKLALLGISLISIAIGMANLRHYRRD